MSIESLKEQARRHEQKEEWRKALDQYKKAIARLEKDDQPDIGLYNRVGDLFVRVVDFEGAFEHYEKAVDLYVEAGLHNNAIAVCKKIVRSIPLRHEVYLKMGQIRADQGFLSDARTSFLTYAERMQQAGDLDESFRALIEFCDLAPEEVELRIAVGEQLATHARTAESVTQLMGAYHQLLESELDERSSEVRDRILELDPEADFSRPEVADVVEHGAGYGDFGGGGDVAAAGPLDGFESTALAEAPSGAPVEEDEASVATGDEAVAVEPHGGVEDDAYDPASEGAIGETVPEEDAVAVADESGGAEDALGELEALAGAFGGEPGEDEDAVVLEAVDDPSAALAEATTAFADDEDGEDDALSAELVDEDEDDSEPLPLISFDDDAVDAGGGGSEAVSLEASPGLEVAALIAERPDDVELRQRALELAYQAGDGTGIVAAFLGLAGALQRSGEAARADATYRHVLDLDPGNVEAAEALGSDRAPAERPVQEVAAHDDYVDLGSLLLGGEQEKSTRFVVAYEEPSGDEDADFAKMLSRFKEKVSQNLDAGDVRAHHDLGTAYKEMGLLDEAVAEFQQALRGSADHLPTYELLGQTFMEMGNAVAAVRTLERALDVDYEVEDELLGIYYHLGRAYQEVGNTESALEFYDRVFSLDINFADVTERLRTLR